MRVIYTVGILAIYILCAGLLFDAPKAHAQSFILQPKASKSNNNNYRRNYSQQKPAYTGGVLISPNSNKSNRVSAYQKKSQNRASRNKAGIYNGVYKSESTLKKEAEEKEKLRVKLLKERNKKIMEKMRVRNEKKMADYREEQKKKMEEAKKAKLKGSGATRPPANIFYNKKDFKKKR